MKLKKFKKIIIYLLLVIIAILICYQSTTNPFIKKQLGKDSSVFVYVAKVMKNGLLPYKDVFDHKGPLLYFINYIGILLNNNSYVGIWIIEILFMIVNLTYMYKISKLFIKNDIFALLPIIISIIPLTSYWQEGNLTEEYALPFIIISLYYMIKYIVKGDNIKKIESFIMGACMCFVLLLRPNMISLWIVYCVLIFIDIIANKKYKEAIQTVIFFLLGTFLIMGICVIILEFYGILDDCINEYIIFNFKYVDVAENTFTFNINVFWYFSKLIAFTTIICVTSIIYRVIKKEKNYLLPLSSLLYIIITFILIILPQRAYLHYAIILIPTSVVPFALFFKSIENNKDKYFLVVLSLAWILFYTRNNFYYAVSVYKELQKTSEVNEYIVRTINEKTDINDKILVIGNKSILYLQSERQADSKYIYQFPIVNVDNKIREEFKDNLKNTNAKLLICDTNEIGKTDIQVILDDLLSSKKYNKIQEVNSYVILERNY